MNARWPTTHSSSDRFHSTINHCLNANDFRIIILPSLRCSLPPLARSIIGRCRSPRWLSTLTGEGATGLARCRDIADRGGCRRDRKVTGFRHLSRPRFGHAPRQRFNARVWHDQIIGCLPGLKPPSNVLHPTKKRPERDRTS